MEEKIDSLCPNEAPTMLGKTSGFVTLLKKEAPHIILAHCFLYRHALASKTSDKFERSFDLRCKNCQLYQILCFYNKRLFKCFCQELGARHEVLLYHRGLLAIKRRSFQALV